MNITRRSLLKALGVAPVVAAIPVSALQADPVYKHQTYAKTFTTWASNVHYTKGESILNDGKVYYYCAGTSTGKSTYI